jgi:hypothetical protein
MGMC